MLKPRLPKVAVVGGSIAGLATGIALRCLGCDVQIYEKSPTSLRGRRGGFGGALLDMCAARALAKA